MTVFIDGPRMPPAKAAKADALVVLLHGYGSSGNDLISLAPYWAQTLPSAAFVSPNAIEPVPGMPGRYQWFALTDLDPRAMEVGVRAAAPSLDRYIDTELKRLGLDESRLAIVGFSQGTMMALHVGLRRNTAPAAVLGYSGMLVGGRSLKEEMAVKPPIQLIHGDRDPTIPIPAMFDAAEQLAAAGHGAAWHVSFGTPHAIGQDGIDLGSAFLATQLKNKGIVTAR